MAKKAKRKSTKMKSPTARAVMNRLELWGSSLEANLHALGENVSEASRVLTSVAMRVKTLEERVFGAKSE